MSKVSGADRRVLAVDPTSRGFGYTLFEGSEFLIDWGLCDVKVADNRKCLKAIEQLIRRYEPDVLVIEDYRALGCRRGVRVRRLLRSIMTLAAHRHVRVARISRMRVHRVFAGSVAEPTKFDMARAIAARLPELEPRLPPVRKPWMSEDSRMAIFDAAGFALTFFQAQKRQIRTAAVPRGVESSDRSSSAFAA